MAWHYCCFVLLIAWKRCAACRQKVLSSFVRLLGERRSAGFEVQITDPMQSSGPSEEGFGSQLPCQHMPASSLSSNHTVLLCHAGGSESRSRPKSSFCLIVTRRPTIAMPRYDAHADLDHHGRWRDGGAQRHRNRSPLMSICNCSRSYSNSRVCGIGCSYRYVTPMADVCMQQGMLVGDV
jgi:hypothetical protein